MSTMTLGEIISGLKNIDYDKIVRFDFCGAKPNGIGSWRGDYSQLSLWFSFEPKDITVGELLEWCEECLGKTLEGYKGGNYKMKNSTGVYVDNWGRYTDTSIVELDERDYCVIIITKNNEYYE